MDSNIVIVSPVKSIQTIMNTENTNVFIIEQPDGQITIGSQRIQDNVIDIPLSESNRSQRIHDIQSSNPNRLNVIISPSRTRQNGFIKELCKNVNQQGVVMGLSFLMMFIMIGVIGYSQRNGN